MSSGFVTESEIEQKRLERQQEWEKVRKPDEPLQAPEELVDTRSLYERLKEQKDRKQDEFDEAHKLKNLVKGLDDDEVDFLDYVDRAKVEEERNRRIEEKIELNAYRDQVSKLREEELQKSLLQEIGLKDVKKPKPAAAFQPDLSIGTAKSSQTKLLASVVKRKSIPTESAAQNPPKVQKLDTPNPPPPTSTITSGSSVKFRGVPYKGDLVCIGVLPGLAPYQNSSDESSSSDDEQHSPVRDLCGRRLAEEKSEEHK